MATRNTTNKWTISYLVDRLVNWKTVITAALIAVGSFLGSEAINIRQSAYYAYDYARTHETDYQENVLPLLRSMRMTMDRLIRLHERAVGPTRLLPDGNDSSYLMINASGPGAIHSDLQWVRVTNLSDGGRPSVVVRVRGTYSDTSGTVAAVSHRVAALLGIDVSSLKQSVISVEPGYNPDEGVINHGE